MEYISLSDLYTLLKRRLGLFVTVFAVLFVLGSLFSFNWSRYKSEATVEIAQPDILANYTETRKENSLESLVDLQISRLQQKVLSTASLVEIITKFDLFANERRIKPMAQLAEAMRKKISINLIGSSLANPASSSKAAAGDLAAIAFTISFSYDDPSLAQKVVNELTSRFMDEDLRQRRSKAKDTTAFLDQQLKTLEASLAEQEKKIAEFRSTNGDIRPEALSFNQQALISTQMNMHNLETQIASNIGTQGALRAQLASTDPYSRLADGGRVLTTPTAQLKALKSKQAELTSRYGPAYPDVVKINREVAALEAQIGDVNASASLQANLTDADTRLATARGSYGAANPDVKKLEKVKRGLSQELKTQRGAAGADGEGIIADADNPAYLQIVAQLHATEKQQAALEAQRGEIAAQLAKYKSAVVANPVAEQQLSALTRDYDNAQMRYRELKANRLAAAMNETIEQDSNGQRLVVINPPELPTGTSPSRLVFLLLSLFFALGAALAVVGIEPLLKGSLVGSRHVEMLLGAAPLVVLPHISTVAERQKRKVMRLRYAGASLAGLVLLAIGISVFIMPLDVLFVVIARRLGLY